MANYDILKAAIRQDIKENHANEIDGPTLQSVLLSMVSILGAGYQYAGLATPYTNPGTPDTNVFYIASTAGDYPNFGDGITLAPGEIATLRYNGTWTKELTGAASIEGLNRSRLVVPTEIYPFTNSTTNTKKYAPEIIEIYIDGTKYTSSDIRIRTLRNKQVNTDWQGERTEVVIADASGDLYQFITYSEANNIEFIHNADYSICLLMNWGAVAAGGYGANYASSADKVISTDVKNINNSPLIQLLVNLAKSGDIEQNIADAGLVKKYAPNWEQYGITSTGGLNTNTSQSHAKIENVVPGTVFNFDANVYRVNLFKGDLFIRQDSDFTPDPGSRVYTSPTSTDYDTIVVSKLTVYTQRNDVKQTAIIPTLFNVVNGILEQKQDFVCGNSVRADIQQYIQNGSINGTTGLLSPFYRYRSLVGFPLSDNVFIVNPVDKLSNKVISFWKAGNVLSRTITVVDMSLYRLQYQADEVSANITLISGNAVFPERIGEISVFTTTDNELKIDKINGIPLVGSGSGDSITQIKAAGTTLAKDGSTVDIPAATLLAAGLLTPEDKAKLDMLTPGDITIDGSGVTKNAAAFGFLPSKTASENVAALRSAVAGGGTILVDYPGTYLVNATVELESNTTIIFGANVVISMQADQRVFINSGAAQRTYSENITIQGLKILTNGHGVNSSIAGLRGYIAFFYIRNLQIRDFTLLDGASGPYVIHICTFENVLVQGAHIEGQKDAVHFGRGNGFIVRDCRFKTYDDPIAINAHDYASGNPEYGDITDGLVENCFDLSDSSTTGYFARLIPGAWKQWESGMSVQSLGDTVVSDGRIYVTDGTSGSTLTSTIQPTFASGKQTLSDGVTWRMQQDSGVVTEANVRNIVFRNIHLQKQRDVCINFYMSTDAYSRPYYPGANVPVVENIILDNVFIEANVNKLISGSAPANRVKIIGSEVKKVEFLSVDGVTYPRTDIVFIGCTFAGNGSYQILSAGASRTVHARITGSIKDAALTPTVNNVTVDYNDIGI